jgi:predicted phage baseplate assembly protein
MPLPDIQLDDRRFEELVQEAKRRIPRYTPEWTDLNDSDPGITLVQLFAWLTEMILYRLNKVPEKNFVKFLELVGMELNPPTPARAELTFKLSAKDLAGVLIPRGTKVGLAEQTDGGPVVFETDDNLYAVGAELTQVQSFDGAQYQLLTEANRVAGKIFPAFGKRPRKDAALYLGFDRALTANQQHRLLFHLYTADLIAEGMGVVASAPEPSPPVIANWEYWAGDAAKWQRLDPAGLRDETASLTHTGSVLFNGPDGWQAVKLGLLQRDEDPKLYWLRYRIEQELGSGYEVPPRLENVLLNTIGATNAVTVTDELLGASDGAPNQEYQLANVPILPGTLILEVDEGEGFVPWTAVKDFAGSKRDDPHYVVELGTGKIRFGDGEQGKIPLVLFPKTSGPFVPAAAGQDLPNIRARIYRWGGGARGNAGAEKITGLQSAIPYVASVTNLRPSEGGQDEETVDEAKLRAPQTIRSGGRAVTAADFEFLATQTPGARIRRAKALPLRHPQFAPTRPPGAGQAALALPVPGVVSVIAVPDAEGANPKPMPTEDTLRRVAAWLQQHALLTTELYVVAPRYRKVEIEARVIASPTARSDQVADVLTRKLLSYFHPLRGGANGTGWGFGDPIYFSEVVRQILTTDGVSRVEAAALTVFVDGQRVDPCTDINLNADELAYSEKHALFVSYA